MEAIREMVTQEVNKSGDGTAAPSLKMLNAVLVLMLSHSHQASLQQTVVALAAEDCLRLYPELHSCFERGLQVVVQRQLTIGTFKRLGVCPTRLKVPRPVHPIVSE